MPQFLFLIFIFLASVSSLNAAEKVGEVNYVRGTLISELNGNARVLANKDTLFLGENLSTGESGFSVIEFKDGTKMSLLPNTSLTLSQLNFQKEKPNALLRLFTGGLRIVTGYISKFKQHNADSFRVQTNVATIGVRGTKFDIRLCDNDCEQPNVPVIAKKKPINNVIGRIADIKGSLQASDEVGISRVLIKGSAIYQHDQLKTKPNGYAVVAFNDNSRMTIASDSIVDIVKHNFNPLKPKDNNAAIRLVRGGMRLLTGLISKLNRQHFNVFAMTATIGIRGTGFDVFCDGNCSDKAANSTSAPLECQYNNTHSIIGMFKTNTTAPKQGLLLRVWDGAIDFEYNDCQLILNEDEVAVISDSNTPPTRVFNTSTFKEELDSIPRPDQVEIPESLYQSKTISDESNKTDTQTPKNGLYVNVRDGDVVITTPDNDQIDLGIGETGHVSLTGDANRLGTIPSFIANDDVPTPSTFDQNNANLINLVGDNQISDNEFQCFIK